MFRKPKRSAKASLRSKRKEEDHKNDDDDDDREESTSQLVEEARRAGKKARKGDKKDEQPQDKGVMHQYEASSSEPLKTSELATRTAQHHPEAKRTANDDDTKKDGIFRDTTRNKFLAGPIKASAFVRTTCQFDYQPDICKDYKDTGFCGFGDTCIYLHDRGDTMTGWQLEQEWESRKKQEQAKQQKEMDAFASSTIGGEASSSVEGNKTAITATDDGIPFACHICRQPFNNPVVTSCGHYFCEKCIMDHVRGAASGDACPICAKDTHGVFNQPTKLLSKKRRLVGTSTSWQEFADAARQKNKTEA